MYVCVFYFSAIGSGGWLSIVIQQKNEIPHNVYDSITPDKYVFPIDYDDQVD